MSFVEVEGARLNYRFDGPDDAPILLLSNSLGTDLAMWTPQIAEFARRFRVLRYDSRGHGASAVTQGPYSIERLGRDALGLLQGLGIQRANVCGLSLGGMVGMWLGTHAPARVAKLLLANTAARIAPPELWNTRIESVRKGGMNAIANGVLARWFTPAFAERAPEEVERIRRMLTGANADGYCACCAAVRDMDQRETVAHVRAPTLVIAGTSDIATPPADGRFLAETIAGARYVEVAAAHLSNIEAADRFTEAALDFLTA